MNRAIILINDKESDTDIGGDVRRTERRYGFIAMMRDIDRALDLLLRRRLFSAIVFPGRTHRQAHTHHAEPGIDDTMVLAVQMPSPRAVGRRPVPLTPEWMRGLAGAEAVEPTDRGIYETARLQPRGSDGGFAERFLEASQRSRHTGDT